MKIKKFFAIIMLLILILISNNVNATTTNVLEVIKEASTTKNLENEQGYISKTIVSSNPEKGEATIELKLANTKDKTQITDATEIFIVLDDSPSMEFVTDSGKTRKELIVNSAINLVGAIYDNSTNVKVGVITFDGTTRSEYDAIIERQLTDSKERVISTLNGKLGSSWSLGGTNIDAGLKKAQKNFSADVKNKIIILLTDGIPNSTTIGKGSSDDVTTDDAKEVQDITKQAIIDVKQSGIYTIAMLTGMDETDVDKNGESVWGGRYGSLEDNLKAAERVFGVPGNSVPDKYYLASGVNVNEIITKDIFSDVSSQISNPINNVKIVDYFPQDVIDNFTFEYEGKASNGKISEKIDEKDNTITWDIGTLNDQKEATVKYKLKLKDMNNAELLEKTISTNEKVVLTYEDNNKKQYTVTLEDSPQIKLTTKKQSGDVPNVNTNTSGDTPSGNIAGNNISGGNNNESNTVNDNTVAPGAIPQTGESIAIISILAIISAIGIVAMVNYRRNKDI